MSLFNKKDKKEDTKAEAEPKLAPSTNVPAVNDSRSYRAVKGPHVTEKASLMVADGKYVFKVGTNANKIEIRRAIEKLYKVHVSAVHILRMPAKLRQVGGRAGERSGYKKAIVTLRKGDTITTS